MARSTTQDVRQAVLSTSGWGGIVQRWDWSQDGEIGAARLMPPRSRGDVGKQNEYVFMIHR
jgi:hypothetical protein